MAAAKSLTTEEITTVLAHIERNAYAQRNRIMFLLTAMAGMRVSEVAAMTVSDVQNPDGSVRSEVFLAAHRVKHNHARTVYINTRLQQEISAYLQSRKWIDSQQTLFPTHRGPRRAFTANTLAQHFFWLYRAAGIRGASSHSGRKTFLTSLSSQGVSVFVLAALAGHRNIATTQRYITVNDDVKRRAVELV